MLGTSWKKAVMAASVFAAIGGLNAYGADAAASTDVNSELQSLKARIVELEAKENQNWLTEERTNQIKKIVEDVLADARKRGQLTNGADVGYNNGFYIQTADKNFKLSINGFMQFVYLRPVS